MRRLLNLLTASLFVLCAVLLYPVQGAQPKTQDMTDEEALTKIYAQAAEFSQQYYKKLERKYGANAANYLMQVKRHDIYLAFVESLRDGILQKIAMEELVHRESGAMIGSRRSFVSSVERARRERIKKQQRRERLIKEREREIGVELEDIQ